MSKTLVLAEKPSVGRELARVLGCTNKQNGFMEGPKYVVTWALGHLVTLATPEEYNKAYAKWEMDHLPIFPEPVKLTVIPQSGRQFQVVRQQMQRADISELVIATDAGREGELVARWIMEKANWRKPVKRLWISSQTDQAIRDGFATLKPGREYEALYHSAQARSLADWLVGFNVSRALTCRYQASLSAGRVQTPTLEMIVAREEEIRRFQPVPYYTLTAKLSEFQALYRNRQNQTHISDRTHAEELQRKCNLSRQAKVTSLKKEQKREAPPLLYDLTELQRDANRRFSFSAKQTLNLMQSLYETHKLLTYPRTDSRYLSSDILPTLLIRVKALTASAAYGKIAAPLQRCSFTGKQRFVNDAKVSDHHAIIPTEQPLNWNALTADEKRIYDLVVRRFLAVLSEDSVYDQTEVQLQIAGETFTAKGKISVSAGWRGIYDAQLFSSDDEDENADEDKDQSLPPLQQGQTLPVQEVRLDQHMTKPPKRYTEATLLTAMENPGRFIQDQQLRNVLEEANGIGTPATRAEIIERLLSANYCERRGKEFYPLSKGEQLLKLAPPDLKSPILTAQWEQKLTLIAKGKLKDTLFLAEMKEYTKRLVEAVKIAQGEYHHDNMTRTRCPSCGQFLLEVNGKKGKMLVCPDRECGYRQNVSYLSNARCPTCHKKLEVVGEGDKKIYTCKCGFREKYDRFNQMLAENKQQASKSEIKRFEQEQAKRIEKESVSAFALAWQNAQKKE